MTATSQAIRIQLIVALITAAWGGIAGWFAGKIHVQGDFAHAMGAVPQAPGMCSLIKPNTNCPEGFNLTGEFLMIIDPKDRPLFSRPYDHKLTDDGLPAKMADWSWGPSRACCS